jgi:uncharacterized low-complexity protein
MKLRLKAFLAPALVAAAVATAAVAGTAVYGYSNISRSAAAAEANEQARLQAVNRWGDSRCMSPADQSACTHDGSTGEWRCTAYVDNQQGSCDRKKRQ